MFVREKRIGAYTYLYLVDTVREDGLADVLGGDAVLQYEAHILLGLFLCYGVSYNCNAQCCADNE